MTDYINAVRDTVADALEAQTASDRRFEGFRIKRVLDHHTEYAPPFIVLHVSDAQPIEYTIGDDTRFDTATVVAELIFKEGHRRTIEGTLLAKQELAQWYAQQLSDALETIVFPEWVTDHAVEARDHHEPEDQPYLFGAVGRLRVEYAVPLTQETV